MKVLFPINRIRLAYESHYQPGVWEKFVAWFERTGYGDVLRLPFLYEGLSKEDFTKVDCIDWFRIRAVRFKNNEMNPAILQMRCRIEDEKYSVPELFSRFVRSIGHTHLLGDFRKHPNFFSATYTGPRFILFDGAGTCLLLGAMFQSMANRCCGEKIQLHYSYTAKRELTHVFSSWQGNFVDPDQKTFVPMSLAKDSALFGYLFQQLGVASYQIYLDI